MADGGGHTPYPQGLQDVVVYPVLRVLGALSPTAFFSFNSLSRLGDVGASVAADFSIT